MDEKIGKGNKGKCKVKCAEGYLHILLMGFAVSSGFSPIAQAEPIAPSEQLGTLLQIVCDLPGELEHPKREVQALVSWTSKNTTGGETVSGQEFSFELAKQEVNVPLKQIIPLDADVRIRFTLFSDPGFKSRFTRGEWLSHCRLQDESSRKMLVVKLSSFKHRKKPNVPPSP